jgi:hypothetical protein
MKAPWLSPVLAACTFCILSATAACSAPPVAEAATARVLIGFREPVDGAAREVLSRLESVAGVSVRYVTSVSTTSHAYELACPAGAISCEAAIRALRADPALRDVAPDRLRKPLAPRP